MRKIDSIKFFFTSSPSFSLFFKSSRFNRSKKNLTFAIVFIAFLTLNGCTILEMIGLLMENQNSLITVEFTLPTNGQTFENGANLGVVVKANDTLGTIDNVTLSLNNSLVRKINGEGPYRWGTANSNYPDNTLLNLSAGTYNLKAVATSDKNISKTASISVTVKAATSNQKPNVFFTTPTDGQTLEIGANLGVIAQATDLDGTISNVKLYINNSLVRTINGEGPYKWGASNGNYPDNSLLNLSAGTYNLKAVATDDKNATNTSSITVMVKPDVPNQNPNLYFTKPNNGAEFSQSSSVEVIVQASDTDGSISKVELLVNNISAGVDSTAPYSWHSQDSGYSDLSHLAIGNYTLKAIATDNNGATAAKSITIKIIADSPSAGSYICTKVKDNLNPYDFTYMGKKLDDLGMQKNIMDDNVSATELKDYFNRQVTFLYHTGHGFSGAIATSSGVFKYSHLDQITVVNNFIATCLTLKDRGWMTKFGPSTNSFSGYTNTTYDNSNETKIIDKFIDKLRNGMTYVMSFYLAHRDLNLYQDRWCIYAKRFNAVVEYSARNGIVPSSRGGIVQLDDSGKLFVSDSFFVRKDSRFISDGVSLGQIITRTSTPGIGLHHLIETSITKEKALSVALDYIESNGELEVDQTLDRIIPIDYREGAGNPAVLGGWEVHFGKIMDDGLLVRSNGPSMHMTVLVTGNGKVISFRKRWAKTNLNKTTAINSRNLMSSTDALNAALLDISNSIKQDDGSLVITGWKLVYGLDSEDQENTALRPAYSFVDDSGTEVIVVNARDGSLL